MDRILTNSEDPAVNLYIHSPLTISIVSHLQHYTLFFINQLLDSHE